MRKLAGLLGRDAHFLPVSAALYSLCDAWVEFATPDFRYERLLFLPVILGIAWRAGKVPSGPRPGNRLLDVAAVGSLGLLAALLALSLGGGLQPLAVFWSSAPVLFAVHAGLVGLLILALCLLRAPWAAVTTVLLLAAAVQFVQIDRPEFEPWRSVVPWSLVVAWAWVRTRGPAPFRNSALVLAVLAVSLSSLPLKNGRYVPPTRDALQAMQTAPGVELLFDNRSDRGIPRYRKEVFCNPITGTLFVTPHSGSTAVAEIDAGGGVRTFNLPDQACDNSLVDGPLLVTGLNGTLATVDLSTGRIVSRLPVCEGRIYYINADPEARRIVVSCGDPRQCVVLDEVGGRWVPNPAPFTGDQCLPVGDDRILIGPDLRLIDLRTGTRIDTGPQHRSTELGAVFNQLFVDPPENRVYVPGMQSGRIRVHELETLKFIGEIQAEPGVRGVLVDDRDPGRLFSWNYTTGRILQHALPAGTIVNSWDVGPILRRVTWDCDGTSLLAVSSQGGFRIRP
jgi:hypothetical protein